MTKLAILSSTRGERSALRKGGIPLLNFPKQLFLDRVSHELLFPSLFCRGDKRGHWVVLSVRCVSSCGLYLLIDGMEVELIICSDFVLMSNCCDTFFYKARDIARLPIEDVTVYVQ
jgi:hypothetical protein